MLATTLHAMAMLLRTAKWDWFINLSASDYPLLTQDGMVSALHCTALFNYANNKIVLFIIFRNADLIHTFSNLPKHLNFVQHTSHLGWKL